MNTYDGIKFDALSAVCEYDHFWNNLSDEKKDEHLKALESSYPYMSDYINKIRNKETFEKDFGEYSVRYENGKFAKLVY